MIKEVIIIGDNNIDLIKKAYLYAEKHNIKGEINFNTKFVGSLEDAQKYNREGIETLQNKMVFFGNENLKNLQQLLGKLLLDRDEALENYNNSKNGSYSSLKEKQKTLSDMYMEYKIIDDKVISLSYRVEQALKNQKILLTFIK